MVEILHMEMSREVSWRRERREGRQESSQANPAWQIQYLVRRLAVWCFSQILFCDLPGRSRWESLRQEEDKEERRLAVSFKGIIIIIIIVIVVIKVIKRRLAVSLGRGSSSSSSSSSMVVS